MAQLHVVEVLGGVAEFTELVHGHHVYVIVDWDSIKAGDVEHVRSLIAQLEHDPLWLELPRVPQLLAELAAYLPDSQAEEPMPDPAYDGLDTYTDESLRRDLLAQLEAGIGHDEFVQRTRAMLLRDYDTRNQFINMLFDFAWEDVAELYNNEIIEEWEAELHAQLAEFGVGPEQEENT